MSKSNTNARSLPRILLLSLTLFVYFFTLGSVRAQQPETLTNIMLAWSPDGQFVALSGSFGPRLYTSDLQNLPSLEKTTPSNFVAWSPDSFQLASANSDGSIQVWDIPTRRVRLIWLGHTGQVIGVTFSPDGSHIASVSEDQTVRIWDVMNGLPVNTLKLPFPLYMVAWSPHGTKLAIATVMNRHTIEVRDAQTLSLLLSFQLDTLGAGTSLAWDKTSKALVTSGPNLWDSMTGKLLPSYECAAGGGTAGSLSPDNTKLAGAGQDTGGEHLCILSLSPLRTIAEVDSSSTTSLLQEKLNEGKIWASVATNGRGSDATGYQSRLVFCF